MKKVKIKKENSNNSTYFCGDDKWSLIYGGDKEDGRNVTCFKDEHFVRPVNAHIVIEKETD